MTRYKVLIILVNVLAGNAILYLHDATEFSIPFSLSSIAVLLLTMKLIKGRWLLFKSITYSLLVTILIPLLGFWMSMFFKTKEDFSPEMIKGLFVFSYIYEVGAIIFVWDKFLIMFVMNLLLFYWLSYKAAITEYFKN